MYKRMESDNIVYFCQSFDKTARFPRTLSRVIISSKDRNWINVREMTVSFCHQF